MQSVPVHQFWQFGTTVRYLQDAQVAAGIGGAGGILQNLRRLLDKLDELNLRVSKRAAKDLIELKSEFEELGGDAKLTVSQSSKLRSAISSFRKTLEAELKGLSAYTISPKRLDIEKLTDDISSLFAPGVFASLSTIAQYDFSEAGKCIAFERPTAAAFHLMRGTEDVLRGYYCHFVRRDRLSPMLWHPMVQALQSHKKAKANDALHRNLDNIRISFRNPTQHPDKVYDIHEVQDLFGLCVDVVNRMRRACGSTA